MIRINPGEVSTPPSGTAKPVKKVHFASQRKSITIDRLDRRVKEKKAQEGYSCLATTWTVIKWITGILVFPLGIYWWWTSGSASECRPDPIIKPMPGQVPPSGDTYSSNDLHKVWASTKDLLQRGSYTFRNATITLCWAEAESCVQNESLKSCSTNRAKTKFDLQNASPVNVAIDSAISYYPTGKKGVRGKPHKPVLITSIGRTTSQHDSSSHFDELRRRSTFPSGASTKGNFTYTPVVQVFRHGPHLKYGFLERPQEIAVLTSKHTSITKEQIYSLLYNAYVEEHDVLILSEENAADYLDVIKNYFMGAFKKVVLAVEDKRAFAVYNRAFNASS